MPCRARHGAARWAPVALVISVLAGCATTTVSTSGSLPRMPLCQPGQPPVSTLVFWTTQWRPDQKEPLLREAAAERGIADFVAGTGCLTGLGIQRLPTAATPPGDAEFVALAARTAPPPERAILVVVRELGPRLTIGLPEIIAGETEVLIDIRVVSPKSAESLASAQMHWRNGGTFVIKGVKTLDQDMSAALRATLMPGVASR